ncbi:TPA: DNA primase [Candidatus Galligastranaerophilus intestinavium]|uniref:DNA primase n=1 Tax=Candidatus Galligastranaerophilus intestinavium TaxID=2840836 RepID=A0A9D1FHB8_9BACT|nr:DNA primase [Candidatus Galligastranaerophilus intestinavium]
MSEITYGQAVEQIKNSLDIVDVISKYVVLKKSGHNYSGLCPFHNEKTPSFVVTPSRQIFKCFGCGEGGDVIAFLMKINNQDFKEVIAEQAAALGIELPKGSKDSSSKYKQEKERLLNAMDEATKFYHKKLLANERALEYLEKRGVGEVAIGKFFLGLAPNSNFELKEHLREKGYTNDEMYKAGLLYEKNGDFLDRFKNRIIIPIMDVNSNTIAFGARAIMEGQNPKYLNSPDSSIYNKSNVLFGLNRAKDYIKQEDSVIIMEGYFDVISAHVAGVQNAVASCGTALTPQHIKLIARYSPSRKIYLAFDSDSAGQKATKAGAEVIKNIFSSLGDIKQYDSSYSDNSDSVCEIRVVSQVGGKDPDEFIREFGAQEYKNHIKNAPLFLDYRLNKALEELKNDATPQQKSITVQQIADILSEIQNPVILSEYIKNISFKINLDEEILKTQIEKSKYKNESFEEFEVATPKTQPKYPSKDLNTRYNLMENNLIKLAFVANTPEKKNFYIHAISTYKAHSEANCAIIAAIDKALGEINNIDELAKKVFCEFYNNKDMQKKLSDEIFASAQYENLDYENYIQAVNEIFERLNSISEKLRNYELKQKIKDSTLSESEKRELLFQQFEANRMETF